MGIWKFKGTPLPFLETRLIPRPSHPWHAHILEICSLPLSLLTPWGLKVEGTPCPLLDARAIFAFTTYGHEPHWALKALPLPLLDGLLALHAITALEVRFVGKQVLCSFSTGRFWEVRNVVQNDQFRSSVGSFVACNCLAVSCPGRARPQSSWHFHGLACYGATLMLVKLPPVMSL